MNWLMFITNIINRVPIERVLFPPPDNTKALEEFAATLAAPQMANKALPEQKMTPTITQEPETTVAVEAKGTACDICSLDHISTCAGILEEANRFARRDGVGSPEVIRRVSICRQQLNALERDDANPQKLVSLPPLQREIMEKILPKAGKVRHRLNEIVSLETLEQVTAETQNLSDEFQNAIFRLQLKKELTKSMGTTSLTAMIEPKEPVTQEPPDADLPIDSMRQRAQELANRVHAGKLSRSEAVAMLADDIAKEETG